MTGHSQPGKNDSNRLLVEVQLSDGPGALLADGRFVIEVKDGIGQLVEPLRSLRSYNELYRLDVRVSELLHRSERDELERLRRLVRSLEVEHGE